MEKVVQKTQCQERVYCSCSKDTLFFAVLTAAIRQRLIRDALSSQLILSLFNIKNSLKPPYYLRKQL